VPSKKNKTLKYSFEIKYLHKIYITSKYLVSDDRH
jgi:hypothetical protein